MLDIFCIQFKTIYTIFSHHTEGVDKGKGCSTLIDPEKNNLQIEKHSSNGDDNIEKWTGELYHSLHRKNIYQGKSVCVIWIPFENFSSYQVWLNGVLLDNLLDDLLLIAIKFSTILNMFHTKSNFLHNIDFTQMTLALYIHQLCNCKNRRATAHQNCVCMYRHVKALKY